MAGLLATVSTSAEVALTATVEKVVLVLTAPANHRLKVARWRVSFDGNSASADQSIVKFCAVTSTITGTTVTPVSVTPCTETLQATAKSNLSAGTVSSVLEILEVHPQTGYEVVLPLGGEYLVPGGTSVGIAVTSAASVNVLAQIWYEE